MSTLARSRHITTQSSCVIASIEINGSEKLFIVIDAWKETIEKLTNCLIHIYCHLTILRRDLQRINCL